MVIKLTRKEKELYPEHVKLEGVGDSRNIIGDFLEWLSYGTDYVVGEWTTDDEITPSMKNTQQLLAEYYNINLNKLEKEKTAMLEAIRNKK